MKKYLCRFPGCGVLLEEPGYCDKHKIEKSEIKPFQNAQRSNKSLYNTTRWRTLRKKLLEEQENCYRCGVHKSESRLEVHHIIPPRGDEVLFFDINNLAVICSDCHKVITAQEINKRREIR
jgi:5-methylcytosine-specific restriction protein A